MKVNINPKKELMKWGPIEYKFLYGSAFTQTLWQKVKNHYPWLWPPMLLLIFDGKGAYILDNSKIQAVGLKYFQRYFLSHKNYQKHWEKWEGWIKKYNQESKKLDQLDFGKINNQEFCQKLESFYKLNIDFWLIVHVPEIANWGGEYLLKKELAKIDREKANGYLEIMLTPIKFSFFQQEELDLLGLAQIKDKAEFDQAIRIHTQKYHWLLNSYGGNRVLDERYFKNRLQDLLKESSAEMTILKIKNTIKKNQQRKKDLVRKLQLDEKLVLIADQLSQSIWWQDLRKGYIWRMNYYWDRFLEEITRRTGWKLSQLQWCWGYELVDLIAGEKLNKEEIERRSRHWALYSEKVKFQNSTDEKLVQTLLKKYLEVQPTNVKEIKGLVVSKSDEEIVKGKVKIINNPFTDGNNMKQGDILVAPMTSPEFIIVMRKAKAIITDQGGMTCHATIISRELKIPCIVNTKYATKVLKDGDLVEIDTNKNIIKKLT